MNKIQNELQKLSRRILNEISFEVINPESKIPLGFKKHTRSISWLAEQVITQHLETNQKKYDLEFFETSKTDISVYDFKIKFKDIKELIYVNSKITWIQQKKQRNDMSSIKKLFKFYEEHKNVKLFYLIFPFEYFGPKGNKIKFLENVTCGEYIKMKDFYLNPRNEHLQAFYEVENVDRTYSEFLEIIKTKQKKGNKIFIRDL
jgi:hypothetical protein|tara:strand:- start:1609 stop:2217 length:609 start_codon:yes stop_codon:yes gene_type:complete